MKILYIIIALAIFNTAYAETPYDKFSTNDNLTDNVVVTWQYADNIQKACNKQRADNGESPYPYDVQACSIRHNVDGITTCTIITQKNLNLWSLGHEIRHCFQGAFHQ